MGSSLTTLPESTSMKVSVIGLSFFLITLASVQSFTVQERGIYDQNDLDDDYMIQYEPIIRWMLANDPTLRAKRVHGALRFHRPWHVQQSLNERLRRDTPLWFG